MRASSTCCTADESDVNERSTPGRPAEVAVNAVSSPKNEARSEDVSCDRQDPERDVDHGDEQGP